MKNYDNAYMAELTEQEMMEENGGMPWIIPWVIGSLAWSIIDNYEECAAAFNEGWNGK